MDPLSQGIIGAALPQALSREKHVALATVLGFLSGMAADLDVLIRSDFDPLLFLEYHRQFTHSIVFIPLGGALCSLPCYFLIRRRNDISFLRIYFYCTAGYSTHALLDACTTYGTLLWWPFSEQRVAWNLVSVIDPLFTLPIVIFVLLGLAKNVNQYAYLALVWALVYLSLGLVQRDGAVEIANRLAEHREHKSIKVEAKPSFGNILVWKTIYSTDSDFYVDAVRIWFDKEILYEGERISKLSIKRDFPWLESHTQQSKDVERFEWFSNGYIAADPNFKNKIIDVRYSHIPNEVDALWGISLDEDANSHEHVTYWTSRNLTDEKKSRFWSMIMGSD